jgi:23S rRNA (guanosine2251-2'-O)-methyltransferase
VKVVPSGKLARLAEGANHQGVVAVISKVPLLDMDTMLANIAATRDEVNARNPVLVLPVRVSDPHNMGAIVRSAVAFGAEGVLLPDRHTARIDATAVKSSAGAALRIPFARVSDLRGAVQNLKERGYWLVGLTASGETFVDEMDWSRPVVIVVGSEASGLPEWLEKSCDYRVSIPIRPSIESLNASVAAAIALFSASRVRYTAPDGN